MTIDKINLDEIKDPKLLELVKALNCTTNYDEDNPEGSIMHYEQLCKHDSGYLCEHRLKYIIDKLQYREVV